MPERDPAEFLPPLRVAGRGGAGGRGIQGSCWEVFNRFLLQLFSKRYVEKLSAHVLTFFLAVIFLFRPASVVKPQSAAALGSFTDIKFHPCVMCDVFDVAGRRGAIRDLIWFLFSLCSSLVQHKEPGKTVDISGSAKVELSAKTQQRRFTQRYSHSKHSSWRRSSTGGPQPQGDPRRCSRWVGETAY